MHGNITQRILAVRVRASSETKLCWSADDQLIEALPCARRPNACDPLRLRRAGPAGGKGQCLQHHPLCVGWRSHAAQPARRAQQFVHPESKQLCLSSQLCREVNGLCNPCCVLPLILILILTTNVGVLCQKCGDKCIHWNIASPSIGTHTTNPWIMSHPNPFSSSTCSGVSTPSATVLICRLRPI